MSKAIVMQPVAERSGALSAQLLVAALAAAFMLFPAMRACGNEMTSVSWSPDGKYVAVADAIGKPYAFRGPQWSEGTIHIVYAGSIGHKLRVKDTIRRTAAQGIPTAVFWTSPSEIAWVSSDAQARFRFLVTTLGSGKVRALGRGFRVSDSDIVRPPDAETYYPPDNLYWDPSGRRIVFCDHYPRQFPDGSIRYKFRIYDLWKDTLQTITIPRRIIGEHLDSFSGVPGVKKAPLFFSSSKDEKNNGGTIQLRFCIPVLASTGRGFTSTGEE